MDSLLERFQADPWLSQWEAHYAGATMGLLSCGNIDYEIYPCPNFWYDCPLKYRTKKVGTPASIWKGYSLRIAHDSLENDRSSSVTLFFMGCSPLNTVLLPPFGNPSLESCVSVKDMWIIPFLESIQDLVELATKG